MKRALVLAGLMGLSLVCGAQNIRSFGFSRFGNRAPWTGSQKGFPKVHWGLDPSGTLAIARVGLTESLYPYDYQDGKRVQRPTVIDDLFYESLMVPDPLGDGETLYPLIAMSLRHTNDFSAVVFELDPAAEFTDGFRVSPEDIVFSYNVFLRHDPENLAALEKAVKAVHALPEGVRFELNVQGQAARDVIMKLAQIKIVRANLMTNSQLGGVKVPFIGTGPYLLGHLGRTQISFVRNLYYWASNRPTRRGFFNFLSVDVNMYPDEIEARNSISAGQTHIFEEQNPLYIDHTMSQVRKKNLPIDSRDEEYLSWGQPLSSLAFNLDRPHLQDVRVRQALILAFDFDQINGLYFGGHKTRPLSFLHESPIAPTGEPSQHVLKALAKCESHAPKNVFQAFETYGQIAGGTGNHRLRLLKAQSLLFEAGFKLSNGRMVSSKDNRQLTLNFLVKNDLEARLVGIFEQDLTRLGILVAVNKMADVASFENSVKSNGYDIVSAPQIFLTGDGWPHVESAVNEWHSSSANPMGPTLKNPNRLRNICMDRLIEEMAKLDPLTSEYRGHAEAIARLQQALALNIFVGELKQRHFLLDKRVRIPQDLSAKKAHMYGFWQEQARVRTQKASMTQQEAEDAQETPEPPPQEPPTYLSPPCDDMSCLEDGN